MYFLAHYLYLTGTIYRRYSIREYYILYLILLNFNKGIAYEMPIL